MSIDEVQTSGLADERKLTDSSARSWASVIRRYRVVKKISQEELALLLAVRQSTVSKWESGSTEPGRRMRAQLAEMLLHVLPELYPPKSTVICSLTGEMCPFAVSSTDFADEQDTLL